MSFQHTFVPIIHACASLAFQFRIFSTKVFFVLKTNPLLFLLYVNDITDGVQSTLEMFANDSKLYRIIKYSHNVDTLQQDLNYISSWSKLWLLNFNTKRSFRQKQ